MKCYHCGHDSVIWLNDYSNYEYGVENEGIVREYECRDCETFYIVYTPLKKKHQEIKSEEN